MTPLLTELREKWREALASGAAGLQWRAKLLSIASPVKLLAAVRERDKRLGILLEAPLLDAPRHRVTFQAEGISVTDERSAEERLLRLAVILERMDLQNIFEV